MVFAFIFDGKLLYWQLHANTQTCILKYWQQNANQCNRKTSKCIACVVINVNFLTTLGLFWLAFNRGSRPTVNIYGPSELVANVRSRHKCEVKPSVSFARPFSIISPALFTSTSSAPWSWAKLAANLITSTMFERSRTCRNISCEKTNIVRFEKKVWGKILLWPRTYARGGGWSYPPPLSLIFYKNFITFARRLSVFAYFLLVNLST